MYKHLVDPRPRYELWETRRNLRWYFDIVIVKVINHSSRWAASSLSNASLARLGTRWVHVSLLAWIFWYVSTKVFVFRLHILWLEKRTLNCRFQISTYFHLTNTWTCWAGCMFKSSSTQPWFLKQIFKSNFPTACCSYMFFHGFVGLMNSLVTKFSLASKKQGSVANAYWFDRLGLFGFFGIRNLQSLSIPAKYGIWYVITGLLCSHSSLKRTVRLLNCDWHFDNLSVIFMSRDEEENLICKHIYLWLLGELKFHLRSQDEFVKTSVN